MKGRIMKLIFCPKCQDIVRLIQTLRKCECGLSWGNCTDELNATIGGYAIPLGLDNSEFKQALQNRPKVGLGSRFDAWVIPHSCGTVAKAPNVLVLNNKVPKNKTELRTFKAELWGQIIIFVAHNTQEVMDYIYDNEIVEGIGPMDLGERIWEIPGYQDYRDGVTVVCVGISGLGAGI
jgi:hypothetical protein